MSESRPATAEETAPTEEEEVNKVTHLQLAKQYRADELRSHKVFIQKSTGKHECTNCSWEYDIEKSDLMIIGGMIKPGTPFSELHSNWCCPTCHVLKSSFKEVTEEIPGLKVNQGYSLGGNSMTTGQKIPKMLSLNPC
eukprot:9975355-Ditylum_brightwellii.AAC.1